MEISLSRSRRVWHLFRFLAKMHIFLKWLFFEFVSLSKSPKATMINTTCNIGSSLKFPSIIPDITPSNLHYTLDCFQFLFSYIRQASSIKIGGIPPRSHVSANVLRTSAIRCNIPIPPAVGVDITDRQFLSWEEDLIKTSNCSERVAVDTNNIIPFSELLKTGFFLWKHCREAINENFNYKSYYCYAAFFINKNSFPISAISRKSNISIVDIQSAAKYLKISFELENKYLGPKKEQVYNLGTALQNTPYNYGERFPSLSQGLHWSRLLWGMFNNVELRSRTVNATQQTNTNGKVKTDNKTTTTKKNNGKASEKKITTARTKASFSDIDIVEETSGGEIFSYDTTISRKCDFCEKETTIYPQMQRLISSLTHGRNFFCPFCIRHNFNTKKRLHVMILSLRALIGYKYHMLYYLKKPILSLSELQDEINDHIKIGEMNPLFSYDHETFCWFIDFSRIGNSRKKTDVTEVIRTVNEMISAFNPYSYIKDFKSSKYTERFQEAIIDFYKQRYRPEGKRICIPTLQNCATDSKDLQNSTSNIVTSGNTKKVDVTDFRNFTLSEMQLHPRK